MKVHVSTAFALIIALLGMLVLAAAVFVGTIGYIPVGYATPIGKIDYNRALPILLMSLALSAWSLILVRGHNLYRPVGVAMIICGWLGLLTALMVLTMPLYLSPFEK